MDRNPTTETPVEGPSSPAGRHRRMAVAAVAALLAVGAGALAVGCGDGKDPSPSAATGTSTTLLEGGVALVDNDTPQPPAPQPSAPQPPAEEPPAEEPDAPQADPGVLAVSKSLIEMDENTWAGSFQVRNEGGSALDWQWVAGGSAITVSQSSGTLEPGEFVDVQFSIDHTELPKGDYLFANMVTSGDQVKDVRVEGTKTIAKNPGIELPGPVIKPND
jgi:hypothetical protein